MCAIGFLVIKMLIAVLSCSNFSAKMEVDAPVFMFLTIINLVLFILATTARGSTSDLTPAYLIQVNCVGVEKRLIDCPRDYPLNYYTCPNKVQVNCSDSDTGSPCMIRPYMYQLLLANNMYCTYIIMQMQIVNVIMDSCAQTALPISCIYVSMVLGKHCVPGCGDHLRLQ